MTRGFLVLIVTAALGCKPTICYFRAQPNFVCASAQAQLLWSASAAGRILDTTSGALVKKTARRGKVTITPPQTTHYRLDATSVFGTTSREIDVSVASGAARELGASIADSATTCQNGTLTVKAEAKPEFWDPRVYAGSVAVLGDRPIHVEHGGAQVDIPAGADTDQFKTVGVLGTWTLSVRLIQGEPCSATALRNIAVRITPTCSP